MEKQVQNGTVTRTFALVPRRPGGDKYRHVYEEEETGEPTILGKFSLQAWVFKGEPPALLKVTVNRDTEEVVISAA